MVRSYPGEVLNKRAGTVSAPDSVVGQPFSPWHSRAVQNRTGQHEGVLLPSNHLLRSFASLVATVSMA